MIKEPRGSAPGQRVQAVTLPLFDGDSNRQALGLKHRRLLLHFFFPSGIQLADMHVDAHLFESLGSSRCRVREVSGKARDRPEIPRIGGGHVKCADAAIGLSVWNLLSAIL